MEQRVSVVTLGVDDLERTRAFYAALGWREPGEGPPGVAFFQAGGMIVGLYPRDALKEDAGEALAPGGDVVLAHNVRSKEEVDRVIAEALAAGARAGRPAQDTFWGGYSGYFFDPDGHAWEVAFNPFWPIADDGSVTIPES